MTPDSSPISSSTARTEGSRPSSKLVTLVEIPARALRAYDVRRARIDCVEGEIWVTGPGLGDEVLARGDSLRIASPGRVVIQALAAARVRVSRSR